MAKKKKFNYMEEPEDRMEKVGGPLALGVIITLLIIIVIVMILRIQSGKEQSEECESTTQTTQSMDIYDVIDTSSQLEEDTVTTLPATSDNDPETSGDEYLLTRDPSEEETTVNEDETASSSISTYNREFLPTENYPKITVLLQRYFKAYKECNATGLIQMVDYNGGTPITMEELTSRAEIVEDYQNLQCYIIEGMDNQAFVVYASYDIKFYNIDTPAPTLTRFYVVISDDGSARIYNGEISSKLSVYLKTVDEYECIKTLSDGINSALEEACAQDTRLEQLMQILYGQGSEE